MQVSWIRRTAEAALVHAALYVIAVSLAGVLVMLGAFTSGGYFGLSASIGAFTFMLLFCIPGALGCLLGFRLQPSALTELQWPLIATISGLVFGVTATGVSLVYVSIVLTGPYDDPPDLGAMVVLLGAPAFVAGVIFGVAERAKARLRGPGV